MPRERVTMRKIREILRLVWSCNLSRRDAARTCSVGKSTVNDTINRAIATGLSWIFYFKALQLGEVSQVAPVDKMSVAFAILLAVIFLGEPLTWKTAIGALMIIGGSLVLIL